MEEYLKAMENLPKEIENLLKKQGKKPTKFTFEKWDTQYEFVNQEVRRMEEYLKAMENLPKEIENLLKKQGKKPTKFTFEKWDTQYEFVNQEVELRRKELKNIIIDYCKLHIMSFDEVLNVVSEVEKEYKHTAILLNKFEVE